MNDDDKTMIQSGGQDGDGTLIRPSPGGRGPAPTPQAPPRSSTPPYGQNQQAAPSPYQPRVSGPIRIHSGQNPIVNAATTLLAVLVKLRNTVAHENISALYSQLVQEMKDFDARLRQEGHRAEIALAARYCLCAALDEAVLNTPWGANSHWAQKTLLTTFHNETSGGQKFFLILDRMLQEPAHNLDMLELLYLILSFGFEGKYRVDPRGREQLDDIRDQLYRISHSYRGDYERELSPHWQGVGKDRSSLINYIPMWVIAACVGAALLLTYSGFRVWLHQTTEPVYQQLELISQNTTTMDQETE